MSQPVHVQTSHPGRKIGRLPAHDPGAHPRLLLKTFLRTAYKGTVPDVVDYSTQVTDWGMFLNDRLGDCTAADYGHGIEVWSAIGQGLEAHPTDDDVVAFYSGSTGYDPADPSTDRGGNMQDVCGYARRVGMAGHRIAAFFQVDPSDADELAAALWLFGPVSIGMDFPAFAMDQTNQGRPWGISRRNTNIEGGHDVLLVKMTRGGNYVVVTWGMLQEVTPAFWARYMAGRDGEAWSRVSPEWVGSAGTAVGNALTVAELNSAFTDLTGQPGPFLTPTPEPQPDPDPDPASLLRRALAALEDLVNDIKAFLAGGDTHGR